MSSLKWDDFINSALVNFKPIGTPETSPLHQTHRCIHIMEEWAIIARMIGLKFSLMRSGHAQRWNTLDKLFRNLRLTGISSKDISLFHKWKYYISGLKLRWFHSHHCRESSLMIILHIVQNLENQQNKIYTWNRPINFTTEINRKFEYYYLNADSNTHVASPTKNNFNLLTLAISEEQFCLTIFLIQNRANIYDINGFGRNAIWTLERMITTQNFWRYPEEIYHEDRDILKTMDLLYGQRIIEIAIAMSPLNISVYPMLWIFTIVYRFGFLWSFNEEKVLKILSGIFESRQRIKNLKS